MHTIYQQDAPITTEQVDAVLAIFERTHTQAYCRAFLSEQCQMAYDALASVPYATHPQATQAIEDMNLMVHFVEETVKG